MSLPLLGKTALVTGASRGIGAAIAQRLGADGANVIVNYSGSADAAATIAKSIPDGRGRAVKADLSKLAGAKSLFEASVAAFGRVDILVLNAGIMGNKTLAQIDEAEYDRLFDMNVKVPLFLTQMVAPQMQPGGRIIFFSTSLTVATSITPNYLVYASSKGAVEQAARCLAKELGAKGITVNVVSPGPIDTSLFREGKPEQLIKAIEGFHPQKRIGKPEEIAPVVAMLAGPGGEWVNGQNIRINGGFTV